MKTLVLLLVILTASWCRVGAQVEIQVSTDQDHYLAGERLEARVRISNLSGRTITLGTDEGWLQFSVESLAGYVVSRIGEVPVVGEFSLNSAERGTKRVDLAPYFQLMRSGRYSITASVYVKEWDQVFTSPPKHIDVVTGTRIWEQEVGIAQSSTGASNGPPEMRKYTLQQANYLQKGLMLYVRVTDTSGNLNRVYPLGPLLSFSQPDPQLDKSSNLHVLYQSGPRSMSYFVINPEGDLIVRQTYDMNMTTRPRLVATSEGTISVIGGVRRVRADDLPAPAVLTPSFHDVPKPMR